MLDAGTEETHQGCIGVKPVRKHNEGRRCPLRVPLPGWRELQRQEGGRLDSSVQVKGTQRPPRLGHGASGTKVRQARMLASGFRDSRMFTDIRLRFVCVCA